MTDAPLAYFNGSYVPKADIRLSPDDRGFLFADGVYEVVRGYGGRLFALEAHLGRLADGLAALRITGTDAMALAPVCEELIRRNRLDGQALIYLQVTRGAAPRRHAFPEPAVPPTVYATPLPFRPRGDPERGIAAITAPDLRWTRCDIKSVALLPNVLAHQQAVEAGAQEAILVRDGVALEGTATSFFGVFGGAVRTAPRSNYILPSITRSITLELCAACGIPAEERPILVEDVARADELFLAGTTVEIMPIVRLDGRPVGPGRPGQVTRRLQRLFAERIAGATAARAPA